MSSKKLYNCADIIENYVIAFNAFRTLNKIAITKPHFNCIFVENESDIINALIPILTQVYIAVSNISSEQSSGSKFSIKRS